MFAAVFTRGALQCFNSHFARAVAILLLLLRLTEHRPGHHRVGSQRLRLLISLISCQRRLRPAAVRDCLRTLVNVQFAMFPQAASAVGVAFFGRSDSFDHGSCEIRNQLADFRDQAYALT